jgi:hypothetical protein
LISHLIFAIFKQSNQSTLLNKSFQLDKLDDFKFDFDDYSHLSTLKTSGCLTTPDGGHLIADKNLQLGVEEFYK